MPTPDCPRCGCGTELVRVPTGTAARVRVLDVKASGVPVWVCRQCHQTIPVTAETPVPKRRSPRPPRVGDTLPGGGASEVCGFLPLFR